MGPQLDLLPYHPLNIALTIFWLITATNAFNLSVRFALAALESFTVSHRVTLRRFWLGVTEMSAPTISDQQLTTA